MSGASVDRWTRSVSCAVVRAAVRNVISIESRDRSAPAPVDEFETDVSIYGVRGMSGNMRDWTATESLEGEGDRAHSYRVVRGGGWYGGRVSARCADRFWFEPPHVYFFVGFRLACTPGK